MQRPPCLPPPSSAALFVAALLLAGCTLGADYSRPADDVPAAFAGAAGTVPVRPTTPWWLTLNDPVVNDLVERARRANPDLGRAHAVVDEARAALAQARAGGAPQLDASATPLIGRSFTPPSAYGPVTTYATAGFDASWELDLWGRNRRTVEAAAANAEVAEAGVGDAMLTLLGDLVRSYVTLRGLQAQIATTRAAIDNQKRANDLAGRRLDGGDGSRLEVLQGGTALQQLQARLPVFEAQVQLLINAMSILCGEPPDALTALLIRPAPIPQGPVPAAGVPADLIRRRPDVRAAERQLAARVAMVGAAVAEQYPSLSLAANLSFSGSSLANVMAMPLFALTPTLKLPILDGGQRQAEVDIRAARVEQARFAYRAAVLKALREVEDAMAELRGETLHRDQLRSAAATARQAVDAARNLYELGATDFIQVLYAQNALNQTEEALAQAEAARTIQVVALFKALGGGWQAAGGPEASGSL